MGLGDLTSGAQIGIGIVVGILSTCAQSIGLTLQRKSHLLEDDRPEHLTKRPPHRRRRWQIGMLLFIIANILGSSIQITTLPLVILSPLQASGLVFNSICATLILAEPFTRSSLAGTILVCVGAGLIAAFGALKEPAHSLDELLYLLGRRSFLGWMAGTLSMVVVILGGVKASKMIFPRRSHTVRWKMARGIAYGCVSGILSAHSLLVAKSAVELLVRTVVDRVNQFNRWQSWLILVGLLVFALSQLFYLHRGLELCSTSVLYPLVFCVYNIIAILDGLIYYQQTSRLPVVHAGLIAVGTLILLTGVFALSWRFKSEPTMKPPGSLAPGMGMESPLLDVIDDDSDTSDIESHRPPLRKGRSDNDKILSIAQRRRALSRVEEIWDELLDDDETALGTRSAGRGDAIQEEHVEEGEEGEDNETVGVNERTMLLNKNPGRRRGVLQRRANTYGFGTLANTSFGRRRVGSGYGRIARSQDATGGWWKMNWWNREREDDRGGDLA